MIKLADEEDIHTVHQLMLEAFEEYRNLDVPSSALNETVSSIVQSIKSGSEQAIVCMVDDVPVGSARFKLDDHSLYFSRVSVSPQARGKGVAKSMLVWLETFAKENNKTEMVCKVRMSLPRNMSLYQSLGYGLTKEEIHANPDGFPVKTATMKKRI
ncbi:GNAT family N-acetyltransferase [Bacillus sp. V59.32b]|uniref:GNAT family N-acetyltransferase n=1 Tax=Bacillus sp. V59.32b TaxID=1758642 RepID=UPI000E3DE537|nr:GNAT family N-acetyltransferase [Bacillus sp. V59.32b]RFU60618.1 GNAT family N-acetyltransferase [Bacillus sp. V59.32b]